MLCWSTFFLGFEPLMSSFSSCKTTTPPLQKKCRHHLHQGVTPSKALAFPFLFSHLIAARESLDRTLNAVIVFIPSFPRFK